MRCSTLRGTFCSLITLATPRQDWTGSNPSRKEGGGCGFTLSRSHSCCAVLLVYTQISPGHIWTTLYFGVYDLTAACCSKCRYVNNKIRQHHVQEIVMSNSSTIYLVAILYIFAQMLPCRGISCTLHLYIFLYMYDNLTVMKLISIPYISSFIQGHNTDCSTVIIMMFWVHFCQQIKSVTSNDYQC